MGVQMAARVADSSSVLVATLPTMVPRLLAPSAKEVKAEPGESSCQVPLKGWRTAARMDPAVGKMPPTIWPTTFTRVLKLVMPSMRLG